MHVFEPKHNYDKDSQKFAFIFGFALNSHGNYQFLVQCENKFGIFVYENILRMWNYKFAFSIRFTWFEMLLSDFAVTYTTVFNSQIDKLL